MLNLIKLEEYPVKLVLEQLLVDKTTNKNIIWATDSYLVFEISPNAEVTKESISKIYPANLQPRIAKASQEQQLRTKSHAEVFTPAWICNKMNNYCDEEWFNQKNLFNTETEQSWIINSTPINFLQDKTWQDYILSKRIEITCGEAPYIVSRYDASTGKYIEINERIGILDRKLRVINENTTSEDEWIEWTYKAFQSVYGYEFQGDNLLIARINLLLTFTDYLKDRWKRNANIKELEKISNIISWNIWQMDGLTGTIPYKEPQKNKLQMQLFNLSQDAEETSPICNIYDWMENCAVSYEALKRERG